MKGKVLEDFNVNSNDYAYKKGDIVELLEIDGFKKSFGIYHKLELYTTIDWIPKDIVEIIEE